MAHPVPPSQYRLRLAPSAASGPGAATSYTVSSTSTALFTVDSIKGDAPVERLRVDLPGRGKPVALRYSAGRKKLSKTLAASFGLAALFALERFSAKELDRKGYTYRGVKVAEERPGDPGKTAVWSGASALGVASLLQHRQIADFVKRPKEGYYDDTDTLVIHGEIRRSDLVSHRQIFD